MRWNWALLDDHIAMDLSAFTRADPPDICTRYPEAQHWVLNYFLNSVLRGPFNEPVSDYIGLLLRRAMVAFDEYGQARTTTLSFVERRTAGEQPIGLYLLALHHWEQCLAHAWQALAVLPRISDDKLYTNGDGSLEEKLNNLHNRSKHTDSAIRTPGQMPARGPVAMWLANSGLSTTDFVMTWSEMGQVMSNLGALADRAQDPIGLREKLATDEK